MVSPLVSMSLSISPELGIYTCLLLDLCASCTQYPVFSSLPFKPNRPFKFKKKARNTFTKMAAAQIVCSFNKFGYCKFRNNCRKMHVNEHCENELCEIRTCRLRHPKPCRYFRDFRRCKFSNCKFKHIVLEIENDSIEQIN